MDWTLPIIAAIAVPILIFLWRSGRISKAKIKAWISRQPIDCSESQLELILKSVETGDTSILNKVKKQKPKSEYVPGPEQIAILSFEKNGGEVRFDMWNADEPGVVKNNDRGRSADLGKAQPVTIVIQNKTYIGFMVDGDRGVGIKLKLDDALICLTTTAKQAWDYLESAKLRSFLTDNLTGRQIVLYIVLGVIIGQLIFFFAKV